MKQEITTNTQAGEVYDLKDEQSGRMLTAQYERAVGGMREVLIFGAMMMQLRERYPEMTQKGPVPKSKSTRGLTQEPMTLTRWLETYAPTVKKPTAIRFLHVTEAIAGDYEKIVGQRVARAISLADLVTALPESLPEDLRPKQLELFDWVNGTSQRSWLDRFDPRSPQKRGRENRVDGPRRLPTAAELVTIAEEEIKSTLGLLDAWFKASHHTRVSNSLRDEVEALLEGAIVLIREVNRA